MRTALRRGQAEGGGNRELIWPRKNPANDHDAETGGCRSSNNCHFSLSAVGSQVSRYRSQTERGHSALQGSFTDTRSTWLEPLRRRRSWLG
ncbi:unnamed protein product [Arctogadus glacialis]